MSQSLSSVYPLVRLHIEEKKPAFLTRYTGDPTIFGNFNVDPSINDAVAKQLNSFKANGYPPADGECAH